ncbi:MAG: FG-GAP repeat domain-containing protein [Myxococcales bacterium]
MRSGSFLAALSVAAFAGGCTLPGGGGSGGGGCNGLGVACSTDASCCNGFFCDRVRRRCALGSPPAGSGSSTGAISGTTCDLPNLLCDGACIPADECGVTAGGSGSGPGGGSSGSSSGGTGSGGSSSGGSTGGPGGSSGGAGGCPVDGGAATGGCTLFAAPEVIPVALSVEALALGDVDGDGRLDLVAAGGGGVLVFLGDGCGGFGVPAAYPIGTDWQALALGPLRADAGAPDIALGQGASPQLGLLLNQGGGLFDAGGMPDAGAGPIALAIADLNRDGKPDLVAVAQGSGSVAVLLGNGDGTFQAPLVQAVCPGSLDAGCAASGVAPLAVADLDGNGWPDIAAANAGENAVAVLLGSDAGLGAAVAYPTRGVGPRSIVAADVNGDGKLDLLTATEGGGNAAPTLELFHGVGGGSFLWSASYVTPMPAGQIAAARLRPGALPDVVLAVPDGGVALIFPNDGSGRLASPELCPAAPGVVALALGDLNGDGKPDAVLGGGGADGGTLAILLNVSP